MSDVRSSAGEKVEVAVPGLAMVLIRYHYHVVDYYDGSGPANSRPSTLRTTGSIADSLVQPLVLPGHAVDVEVFQNPCSALLFHQSPSISILEQAGDRRRNRFWRGIHDHRGTA